jgi:hypothetical protein
VPQGGTTQDLPGVDPLDEQPRTRVPSPDQERSWPDGGVSGMAKLIVVLSSLTFAVNDQR